MGLHDSSGIDMVSRSLGILYECGIILGLFVWKRILLVESERVDMSRSQVVYSIVMVIIEACKFFGEYLHGQKLELEGEGDCFAFGIVAACGGWYLVSSLRGNDYDFYLAYINKLWNSSPIMIGSDWGRGRID